MYFPISGNPIGFNHFAGAEWLSRAQPFLRRVVFVLSNGHHPDPTKPDAEVGPEERLRLCEISLAAISAPEESFLARIAERAGATLRIAPSNLSVSTVEFPFHRAVPTAELLPLLKNAGGGPLHWFAGADLIRRMADPDIFGDADLEFLAQHLHYHVLERDGDPPGPAVAELRKKRGVQLTCHSYPLSEAPEWLAPFLSLSSTLIRNAAEAGDPLGGMLPHPAAREIASGGLYRKESDPAAPSGRMAILAELSSRLDDQSARLSDLLADRGGAGRTHSLSLVETTTGGLLTAALAGRAGASRFFRQARFAYDDWAKTSLLAGPVPGKSAVSAEAVSALAAAMRREARTDFALAESGMAGPPDGFRRSMKAGQCWMALATAEGTESEFAEHNPFLTRKEHQLQFALRLAGMLRRHLLDSG